MPCRVEGRPSCLAHTAAVAASSAIASAMKDDEQPVVMKVAPLPMMVVTPYSPRLPTIIEGLSIATQAAEDAACLFRKPPSEKIMISFQ